MYVHPLLALLNDSAYEPLILLDEDRRVVTANQAARSLLPETAITGGRIESLIDSPDLSELLDCVIDDPNCPEAQFKIGPRTYRARCTQVRAEGKTYIALAMQDISELMRLNRARRDMVANISHELRTPISAIRLLRDTLSRQRINRKQRDKVLRKIGRELDTLQRIVDGMHDLSMIESGQSIMKLQETSLLLLTAEAVDHLDEQIEDRRLEITIDIPESLYVLVDRTQMSRVLANLVHNAIKVTPKKGAIHIGGAPDASGQNATVCVEDSGPGIPPQERERIFERFYQLDESRSQGRGSGLGLSIARHIVEAHSGRIWVVESALGGARFCFTLLATEAPDEQIRPSDGG